MLRVSSACVIALRFTALVRCSRDERWVVHWAKTETQECNFQQSFRSNLLAGMIGAMIMVIAQWWTDEITVCWVMMKSETLSKTLPPVAVEMLEYLHNHADPWILRRLPPPHHTRYKLREARIKCNFYLLNLSTRRWILYKVRTRDLSIQHLQSFQREPTQIIYDYQHLINWSLLPSSLMTSSPTLPTSISSSWFMLLLLWWLFESFWISWGLW